MFNPESKIVLSVANPSHHMDQGQFSIGVIWSNKSNNDITSRNLLHINDKIQLICVPIVHFDRC